jgi:hypothetical protein
MQVDNIGSIPQELKRVLAMAFALTLVFMALAPLASLGTRSMFSPG